MFLADFYAILKDRRVTTSARIWCWMVQSVDGSRDFFYKTAVHKLMHLQLASAVRTLLSLFGKPFLDTVPAAEL